MRCDAVHATTDLAAPEHVHAGVEWPAKGRALEPKPQQMTLAVRLLVVLQRCTCVKRCQVVEKQRLASADYERLGPVMGAKAVAKCSA